MGRTNEGDQIELFNPKTVPVGDCDKVGAPMEGHITVHTMMLY